MEQRQERKQDYSCGRWSDLAFYIPMQEQTLRAASQDDTGVCLWSQVGLCGSWLHCLCSSSVKHPRETHSAPA